MSLFSTSVRTLVKETSTNHRVLYITPARLKSLYTIAMHIMLISIPIGPLLILEDGFTPSIGSALLANFSSISAMGFMEMM